MARQIRSGLYSCDICRQPHTVFFIQPLGIERSGNISCPLDGALQVGTQLVHAAHENAALRSEQRGRHAVALTVDVDDLAGLAQSVR